MRARRLPTLAAIVPLLLVLCCSQYEESPPSSAAGPSSEGEAHPLELRPQPWQRRGEPILSIETTKQAWSKTMLYSPSVVVVDGVFKMWYVGSAGDYKREHGVLNIGYAESQDGVHWKAHQGNPVLRGKDIPFAPDFQTPYVLFDQEEQIYKMWFIGMYIDSERMDQTLGYATSADGISWDVHPEPLYWSGRSPSVIKEGPNRYRMWMNSRPSRDTDDMVLYGYIYEFTSSDGIHWERGEEPVILPSGKAYQGVIYPYVLKEQDTFHIWYGSYEESLERFHLYSATSQDGSDWTLRHDNAAFSARDDAEAFDAKYVSTPWVVSLKDRYLLYYSARDNRTVDGGNIYQHIGLAEIPKPN